MLTPSHKDMFKNFKRTAPLHTVALVLMNHDSAFCIVPEVFISKKPHDVPPTGKKTT